MMKKCLIFILMLTLCTGIFGLESHAAESEIFLDPFPIYRMSLTKDNETVMYTAFYVQDSEGNIYLISSAFAGAAMRDGWKATLHTASGEKRVEHLKNENGICYLKAEIPEQSIILEIEDDDDYEDGRILCAKKVEEKAEDGSVITRYTWGKWYVDFIGWYQNGAYYINDEMYMSKVYLEDVLKKKEMTSKELCALVGITEANLSILRSGKAKGVRFSTINKICYYLECDVGDILKFDGELEGEENED